MSKIIVACLICLFSVLSKPCLASNEAYEFVNSYIESLSQLVINSERAERLKTQDYEGVMADMTSILSESRQGITRLMVAKSYIEPYLNSKNELINKTSKSIADVLDMKILNAESQLKLFEDMVSKPDEFDQGRHIIEAGKVDAENEMTWDLLNQCSVAITYCLVDPKPDKDGLMSNLAITSAEREALIKKLDDLYGESIKDGMQAGQTKLVFCGSILKKFLTGKHHSSDEKNISPHK